MRSKALDMFLQSPTILILMALVIVVLLLYWDIRERSASRANKKQSRHTPAAQRGIRVLFPLLGMILVAQLLGIQIGSLAVPRGLSLTLAAFGHVLFWGGILLALWARETLGHNWAHAADYQVVPGQQLVVYGPYRFSRHPIYTGLLLMFIGVELVVHSWLVIFAIPLFFFLRWQAGREEHLLLKTFGDPYSTYMQNTGCLFPRSI
ncbi:MAG: protein-S-isoprenylcysteine methyltransferase [Parcubacteria group bacterium Gr01-1014_106]|nr:MAG: protein-S-isoprenylcysteine methyltransferase [Parcubacteria group bacterium Gr01-1014_106]